MPKYRVVVKESAALGRLAVADVKGEPCILPGYEAFSFFIHHTINKGTTGAVTFSRNWTVTDAITGQAIVHNFHGKKAEAIKAATEKLASRLVTSEGLKVLQLRHLAKFTLEVRRELVKNKVPEPIDF